MDELLCEVLDLQRVWQAQNTDAMKRRGVLIRTEISEWLRGQTEAIAEVMGLPVEDVKAEGRDGTGLKTEVAWVRIHSQSRSPSATNGWYVVYLFSGDGERVYLSLNQGTTQWNGGEFKPRKTADLRKRVDWARPKISHEVAERTDLLETIHLSARTPLGRGYEPGNVIAIEYHRDAIPGPGILRTDLLFMARVLGALYRSADATPYIPGDVPLEVREATQSAATTASRRTTRGSGQGFLLTAAERRAIELHSVRLATEHFEAEGWSVKDVGATKSYDLHLTRGEERLHMEVKGTTSDGGQVILTRAEVESQREFAPANALVIVHSIALDRSVKPVTATGGVLHCTSPWQIEDDSLTVVSYIHRTSL
ncbi:MrcB family domain-containing protein [Streptomyces sp. NPDC090306]|uniref:MrcB family domain-containing protein n=1 Tax=Streptomyces sp. NPDC090306 TaxID=3365961 RepID=UPI0038172A95